jgi:hypothetical protein
MSKQRADRPTTSTRTATTGAATRRAVERAAARLAKERRIQQVRPGWWVFSYGPLDLGSWGKVTAALQFTDPTTGRPSTRLTVVDSATGRQHEVQHVNGFPAWCCTPAEARRAGLT